MPAAFDKCVAEGGKVWTESGKKGYYRHLCRPKGTEKIYKGHWKKRKARH